MMNVSISVNGNTVYARSARNTSMKNKNGTTDYVLDTGEIVEHNPEEGIVVLAKKLLDTIKEV